MRVIGPFFPSVVNSLDHDYRPDHEYDQIGCHINNGMMIGLEKTIEWKCKKHETNHVHEDQIVRNDHWRKSFLWFLLESFYLYFLFTYYTYYT